MSRVAVVHTASRSTPVYSDGIAEAASASGELYTFDRTVATIREACAQALSPDAVIDHLIAAVRMFTGDAPQADDMTCVVVKIGNR